MPQSEDNKIDDLFREAAANVEFAYDPGYWTVMEKSITLVRNTGFVWKGTSFAIIIALLGSMGYYELKTSETQSGTSHSDQLLENRQTEITLTNPQVNNTNSEKSNIETLTGSNEVLLESSPATNTQGVNKSIVNTENPAIDAKTGTNREKSNIETLAGFDDVLPDTSESDTRTIVDRKGQLIANQTNQSEIAIADLRPDNNWDLLRLKSLNLGGTSSEIVCDDELELIDIEKPKKASMSRFAIGLSFAPDYSGVNFNGNKAGYGLGLGLGYSISRRFTIGVGLLYAKKRYDVVATRYQSYSGAWAQISKPERIEANCDVIEIPINLRYYFLSNSRSKIFLSSGISSYLMKAEDYLLRYPGGGTYEMNARNENNHLLSVLNMSIGIEKQLTRQFGIEIEPYLRFPLTGIGMGKVDLTSSGIFITGKYYFGK
ncbi:MAG: outer membrane beta-barrel protein [Bacteroidetes bacterium]|nr:outer membrane beta-barrel protein [Bacteroidota bacterium]MDA1121531.1 outer membrane beta-barrel protein [Bacteroidota bacterium]